MHGGVKFYRGSASAARTYVEADRSRVDDYYLAEGTGLATRMIAERPDGVGDAPAGAGGAGGRDGGRSLGGVRDGGTLEGPAYERWVAGYDVETGAAKGRLRTDARGLRFVEVVVNGPKTWSLAAALHPGIAAAYDAAQDRAVGEIIGWLAEHATTRIGPRGRQVQIGVEQLEAAVVRHYTSRAGDPHRHLHLQVNARVYAAGRWRGLHSVGVVDSIEALNGIGHAAVACDPEFRAALTAHGYTLDPGTGEVTQLAPYAARFSARAAQIGRHVDRYEAEWRRDHPNQEPDARLRRTWDRRAWAQARPDKVVPIDGRALAYRWIHELHELGFTPPPTRAVTDPALGAGTPVGRVNRDACAELALVRLGGHRSSWNTADLRGEAERIVAELDVVTDPRVRRELAEDLTARSVRRCVPLLDRGDVPEHVRALTSREVLAVETDLVDRLTVRGHHPARPTPVGDRFAGQQLDQAQRLVIAALVGTGPLIVVEGAAGAGKTTTLAAASSMLEMRNERLVVVTPTLKAAHVAQVETGADAYSAAWLVHQHGWRWDDDGAWTRPDRPPEGHYYHSPETRPDIRARLYPGDLLLIDEAGMLDQDTARALLTIADETGARIAFLGDRHQLPAVGRGGVLDHAARAAPENSHLALETVHRFTDPDYADLTLQMRTGQHPGEVFDALHQQGLIAVHPSDVERHAVLTDLATQGTAVGDGARIIADTRDQVAALSAAIRDHRLETGQTSPASHDAAGRVVAATSSGEPIGIGDRVTTRRNDRDLGVVNRDRWTVTGIDDNGGLQVRGHGRRGERTLPADYVQEHVELDYATTVHGVQGETVDHAHLLLGETTGAAAAYVAMTRGRRTNTAHLVAETLDDARAQWIDVFNRDRADLGPAHAAETATDDIERYGPQTPFRAPAHREISPEPGSPRRRPEPPWATPSHDPSPGISR